MRVSAITLKGRMAHAFLDGVDVSHLCVAADDDEGWVDLLVTDDNGRPVVDWHNPAVKRHTGSVVIEIDMPEVDK